MDKRPIGVCDSGVGGIVVLSEIIKLLPNESFVYLGDTARFPYGTKSEENIVKYTKQSIEYLINQDVKMIVVACGTASTVLEKILKKKYNVPIIGVLEPTLVNIDNTVSKLGIIATSRTIASGTWNEILKKDHPNLEIIGNPCPILAPLAEAGWTDNEIARLTIREYLKPFKKEDIDELLLGCTHYPLFKKIIAEELPGVNLIDVGEMMAIYLERYLVRKDLQTDSNKAIYKINITDMDPSYYKLINNLFKGIIEVKEEDINRVEL